jgi:hypothetical protein
MWGGLASIETETSSSHTHRTQRSTDLAKLASSRVFHSDLYGKSEETTHEHKLPS